MLYPGISLVSIFGLHGTLFVQRVRNAEGVSLQIEGPYEADVANDSQLIICREGQESLIPRRFRTDLAIGGTRVGALDVIARVQFLTEPYPRISARVSAGAQDTVRITAPRGTRFELIGCYGLRKGPFGRRFMRGNSRFDAR